MISENGIAPKWQDLKSIFDHYGERHQLGKLKEECMELVEAVDDFLRIKNVKTMDHLLEEMADVKVVIDQFRTENAYDSIIRGISVNKVDRQIKRIEQEKKVKCENGICYIQEDWGVK